MVFKLFYQGTAASRGEYKLKMLASNKNLPSLYGCIHYADIFVSKIV